MSSLGFSLGAVFIRFFSDTISLAFIINLQSIVVFSSFILQFGLRAALRVHIYSGRLLLAKRSSESLYVLMLLISLLGFFIEVYIDTFYFISLSCLLSIVTLKLTISIAKNTFRTIFGYSLLNFIVTISSSLLVILIKDLKFSSYIIEISSITLLLLLYSSINWRALLRHFRKILKVYWGAQSYQLGSCVVALFVFLLTQTAVVQFKGDDLIAYSDALILSGLLVMLIGKAMLLFEKNIYGSEDNQYALYVFILCLQICICAVFSTFLYFYYNVSWTIMFSVIFVLLSRTSAGYVVQYVEKNRWLLNIVSGIFFILYALVYFTNLKELNIGYHFYPVFVYLLIGFLLLKNIDLKNKAFTERC